MNSSAQTMSTPLVLVVEDEPGIASVLTAYLERDGLRSRVAVDGHEAVQLFRQIRPDLVLLDSTCRTWMAWTCCAPSATRTRRP